MDYKQNCEKLMKSNTFSSQVKNKEAVLLRIFNSLGNHAFVKSESQHSKRFSRQCVEVDISNIFNSPLNSQGYIY